MSHFFGPCPSPELEAGVSHFFGPCPRSELETGMSLFFFFRVARVEFRVKFRVEAVRNCGQLYQASLKNMTYKKCPSLQSGSRSASSAVAVRAISSHSAVGML